ncbi:hypothetical protein RMSM_02449 [Rhodopirellula maiorica SM1]|uniref:Uncharacterized protein n=1 Tax=Rhodopirellula maiorica SM1 TaxID=1265738 RepID=M5RYY9_9BACT|nr:DUF6702 family protein [Rhodopirellula maiorica]EMI20617.1 hypothetical protein RMSM_02449 [Rhodopirellula maiorica SM1]
MFQALLFLVMMHPVHETVSEVQWNHETKRFEIALRLHVVDQQWIEHQADKSQGIESVAVQYLNKTFQIRPLGQRKTEKGQDREPSKAKIHWVGRKDEGSHMWWYFEVEPVLPKSASASSSEAATKTPKFEITQQMFFERHEGFTNRVILLGELSKTAFTLTIEHPTAPLEESIDEQSGHPRQPHP